MYYWFFSKVFMASPTSPEEKYSALIVAARMKNVPMIFKNPTPSHLAPYTFCDFYKVPNLLYYSCWFWHCKKYLSPEHTLLCRYCSLRYCKDHELPNAHRCTAPRLISVPTKIGRYTRGAMKIPLVEEDPSLEDFETITDLEIAEINELNKPIPCHQDEDFVKRMIADAMEEDDVLVEDHEPVAGGLRDEKEESDRIIKLIDAFLEEK